jgi:glucose-6-phosphate isomerase
VEERDIQEVFTDIVNIGGGSDLGPLVVEALQFYKPHECSLCF